jgi:hypothetical protein
MGVVSIELAICLPVLVMLFYHFHVFALNMRMLEVVDRATACLADVLANTEVIDLPHNHSMYPTKYDFTIRSASEGISDDSIKEAFSSMVAGSTFSGETFKAEISILYSPSAALSDWERKITINGNTVTGQVKDTGKVGPGKSELYNNFRKPDAKMNASREYTDRLIRVKACVKNPSTISQGLARYVFPAQYCSTFVASRKTDS